jgi:hypothetical protein
MPYARHQRSFLGDDTATTTSIDLVGVPILQLPPTPAPPSYTKYVLWGGGALLAYWLLFKR